MDAIPAADLAGAFDRLLDFRAVQVAEHGDYTVDGVTRLQAALGIDDEERRLLVDRLPEVSPTAPEAAVLLGVLLGLLAAGR